MSACPALADGSGAAGLAQALRAIDCRTGEAAGFAFGRLFGADGRLLPALTLLLTLYVGFFAVSLLTGRARLGVAALTPRMLTLGLVLTFATSWAAYQNVVWTLASGAPDQVAAVLTGSRGSASLAFADRLDALFGAVADAARQASLPGAPTATGITPAAATVGGFSSSTALWLCATLLMLATAGVLVTARIALAALLALGPVFIVLGLFAGTRGLFAGWLKAIVMFALAPLLTVLVGGGAIGALAPVVRGVAAAGGQPPPEDVAVLFIGTCVYCALMIMVLKAAGAIVAGWRLPGEPSERLAAARSWRVSAPTAAPLPPRIAPPPATQAGDARERVRGMIAHLPAPAPPPSVAPLGRAGAAATAIVVPGGEAAIAARAPDRRAHGIGGRFRQPAAMLARGHVS